MMFIKMKKLSLIAIFISIIFSFGLNAKEFSLNQLLNSTSKLNSAALQKTSTPICSPRVCN